MVLSNSKLKRKKREEAEAEAEAAAALAPLPDSNAIPSSQAVVKSERPAVFSSKEEKRKKAKKAIGTKGNAGVVGTVGDVTSNGEDGIDEARIEGVVEDTTLQDVIVEHPKKKQRKDGKKGATSEDTPGGKEESKEKSQPPGREDVGSALVAGGGGEAGVIMEGSAGQVQAEGEPKTKIRKKPRWPVGENGKRIRPGNEGLEGQVPTGDNKDPALLDGVDKSCEKPSGDAAAAVSVEVDNSARIVKGDEPWLESKRKKKKEKLTDKWGKKLANGGAVDNQHANSTEAAHAEPRQEKLDPKKVMVGGMPYYITEDDIHEFFQECGTIAELDSMTFPDTGKFKGIAFITFRTEEAAKRALALDGADMGGRFLKIDICKIRAKEPAKKDVYEEPPKKYEGCLSAYIGNLSWDITEKELRKFFKGCKIDAIRFAVDKETGGFRGFGHVDFSDDESLETAMKLDQMDVLGRPIKVAYSVPKKNQRVDGERRGGAEQTKKKGCFTCGEEGHMSYNCPKKPLH